MNSKKSNVVRSFSFIIMLCLVMGCGNNNQKDEVIKSVAPTPIVETKENETEQKEEPITMEEAKEIMINKYGFSEEEIEGYDVRAYLQYMKLDRPVSHSIHDDPPIEIVRDDFNLMKEDYLIGGYNSIFGFLGTSPSEPISTTDKFVKVGIKLNIGESPDEQYVYDLTNKVYYHDDVEPMEMSDSRVERISNIVKECNITSWDVHTVVDDDEGSTGSYGWSIVFELENGTDIAYKGFVQYEEDLFPDFVKAREILAGR